MMFLNKSINGLAPVYLRELFSERDTNYDLRDSFRKLNLPRKPRTNYLKRSFCYSGALLWNSLPESIWAIRSMSHFTVAYSVTRPMNGSEAAGYTDLAVFIM